MDRRRRGPRKVILSLYQGGEPARTGPAARSAKAVEPDKPGKVNEVPWTYIGVGALILFLVIFIIVIFVLSRNDRRRDWEE